LAANLPTDPSGCEGDSINPLPINQDQNGNFTAQYTISAWNSSDSSITCDATHFCVLWVGIDYNNAFTSNYAFSAPFEVGTPPAQTPETPLVIALPIAGVVAAGGTIFFIRRRRNHASVPA
jgi:hypothetical protein